MACGAALRSIRTYTKMRFSVMSAKNEVQGPDMPARHQSALVHYLIRGKERGVWKRRSMRASKASHIHPVVEG